MVKIDKVLISVGEITKFLKVLINWRRGNYVGPILQERSKRYGRSCADIVRHWLSEQFRGGRGGPCTYSCRQ
jgi:hypothetical protein